jgi:Cu/Ag efflux protein CusF
MTRLLATLIGTAWLTMLGGCVDKKAAAVPPAPTTVSNVREGDGKIERQTATTVTATVVAIDQGSREVTLRNAEGKVETITVGPEVRNLPQVRKGDRVVATYYESLALELKKPGEATPGIEAAEGADRAQLGQKPGAAGARTVKVTAKITAVDRKTQMVTLKGPKGKVVDVHVKDPARLAKVKKGDLVDITYTEALAIAVEAAPK